jgi:glycosyltransferase involved in cell wall biosynthesis
LVSGRRFAFVTPNYYPLTCGVGDFSMRLAGELQTRGHEVAIFTHEPARPHPEAKMVDVHGAAGMTPWVIAERLRASIAAYKPTDLVLQYTPQMLGAWRWGSPATIWLAAAAKRLGARVTLLAHELFLAWNRRPDLAAGALALRAQMVALLAFVDRALVTMEMRIPELAPFATLARHRTPIGVVRIGSNAIPVPRRTKPGRLRLGVFSTLASTKRFDVVLDCFQIVQQRSPHAELVLLGDLADTNRPLVRSLLDAVERHPARSRIRVPGKQELATIAEEVADLDVYLFPMISGANTRSSTLPLPFAAGVPVVAINSYETDGVFVDGRNVVFAEALSGEKFAAAIGKLEDNPILAARVVEGGKELYRDHLSWARVGDQFLSQV